MFAAEWYFVGTCNEGIEKLLSALLSALGNFLINGVWVYCVLDQYTKGSPLAGDLIRSMYQEPEFH